MNIKTFVSHMILNESKCSNSATGAASRDFAERSSLDLSQSLNASAAHLHSERVSDCRNVSANARPLPFLQPLDASYKTEVVEPSAFDVARCDLRRDLALANNHARLGARDLKIRLGDFFAHTPRIGALRKSTCWGMCDFLQSNLMFDFEAAERSSKGAGCEGVIK